VEQLEEILLCRLEAVPDQLVKHSEHHVKDQELAWEEEEQAVLEV